MDNTSIREEWNKLLQGWSENGVFPGRNDRPAALFDIYWQNGEMDTDLLAWAVSDAWVLAEFPLQNLEAGVWLDFFTEVGFIENGECKPWPDKVPTLYRGCADTHSAGMSWTDDYDTALWFYERNKSWGFKSVLLKLDAESDDVLAHFHGEDFRDENEWVVHPSATRRATQIEVKGQL